MLELGISCAMLDWQLSSLTPICALSLPLLPALECLGIHGGPFSRPQWQDDMEDGQWVELFFPFTNVMTPLLFGSAHCFIDIFPFIFCPISYLGEHW